MKRRKHPTSITCVNVGEIDVEKGRKMSEERGKRKEERGKRKEE